MKVYFFVISDLKVLRSKMFFLFLADLFSVAITWPLRSVPQVRRGSVDALSYYLTKDSILAASWSSFATQVPLSDQLRGEVEGDPSCPQVKSCVVGSLYTTCTALLPWAYCSGENGVTSSLIESCNVVENYILVGIGDDRWDSWVMKMTSENEQITQGTKIPDVWFGVDSI